MAFDGNTFVAEIQRFIGDPYVYGGAGPTNFDCSGLVQYGLEQQGLKNVPRTSEAQWAWVQKIQYPQLQPGDLIFSQWPGDDAAPGHVAVYAGGGQLIEAPSPGHSVHRIPFDAGYRNYVIGYGRIPGAAVIPGGGATGAVSGLPAGAGIGAATGGIEWWNPLTWFTGVTSDVATAIMAVSAPFIRALSNLNDALTAMMRALLWIINPANWVRIVAGGVGAVAALAGLYFVSRAA